MRTTIHKVIEQGPSGFVLRSSPKRYDSLGRSLDIVRSRSGGGRRGSINEFSRGSRSRLLDLFCFIRPQPFIFITLTFGDVFPDPSESKKVFKCFCECVRRDRPDVSFLWRLELQARGAVHYHIVAFGNDLNFDLGKHWLRLMSEHDWYGSDALDVVAHGVDQRYSGLEQSALLAYISKYAAKTGPSAAGCRSWGIFNRNKFPIEKERHEFYFRQWFDALESHVGYDSAIEIDTLCKRVYSYDGVGEF